MDRLRMSGPGLARVDAYGRPLEVLGLSGPGAGGGAIPGMGSGPGGMLGGGLGPLEQIGGPGILGSSSLFGMSLGSPAMLGRLTGAPDLGSTPLTWPGREAKKAAKAAGTTGQSPEGGGGTGAAATPQQMSTPTFSGTPGAGTRDTVLRWVPLAQKYSQKYGVPVEIILASIDSESGGDPNAIGPDTGAQGRAYGLLQGMQIYWGKNGNLRDPDYNLDTIVGQLMKPAWDKYRSAAHVRAVTYGGPGAIDSNGQIKGGIEDAGIPGWTIAKDVARYLPKVEAYKQYLAQQQGQQQQPTPPAAAASAGARGAVRGWTNNAAYTITGEFGQADGPYPGGGHVGMDIGTPSGTPITAAQGGTIVHAGGDYNRGGYGNSVVMRTDDGFTVILGHLSQVGVSAGGRVAAGQLLGQSGSTGHSTGPHLHLEVRDAQGRPINPRSYFSG
jgi:hypothetical protein